MSFKIWIFFQIWEAIMSKNWTITCSVIGCFQYEGFLWNSKQKFWLTHFYRVPWKVLGWPNSVPTRPPRHLRNQRFLCYKQDIQVSKKKLKLVSSSNLSKFQLSRYCRKLVQNVIKWKEFFVWMVVERFYENCSIFA